MNKLEIRGVIVPSSYDGEWANSYIEKGLFIPESRVRSQLKSLDTKGTLSVYINSPGGSVFAGNEIINALNEWARSSGQKIEITVGAMAASMAAAMIVSIPSAKVMAHKNSKIMFHGAWQETVGGEQAHKDQADLLAKINNDLKATLISRYNLTPEVVAEWFAEGREGWLNAEDAKKIGMVQEIIDSEDAVKKISKQASAMLAERGLKLAACLEGEIIEQENDNAPGIPSAEVKEAEIKDAQSEPVSTGPQGSAGTGPGAEAIPAPPAVNVDVVALSVACEELKAQAEAASLKAREWQAKHDRMQADSSKAKLAADAELGRIVAAYEAKITEIKAEQAKEIELLAKTISERDSAIAGLESRVSKYTLSALAMPSNSGVTTWAEAMAACNGSYAKARKEYPAIYASTIKLTRKA